MGFNDKCYNLLKKVPKGKVVTYGEIARTLHCRAYRAVGRAMNKNHNKKVHCYKVVRSNGAIGGFNLGEKEKIRLLRKEGIIIKNKRVDMNNFEYKFST